MLYRRCLRCGDRVPTGGTQKAALLEWARGCCQARSVPVASFAYSFSDGLAFVSTQALAQCSHRCKDPSMSMIKSLKDVCVQCAILDSHQLLDWAAARVPASNQRWRQQNLELAFGPTARQLLLVFCPTLTRCLRV